MLHTTLRPLHLVRLPLSHQRVGDYPGGTTRRRKGPTSTAHPPLAVTSSSIAADPFSPDKFSTCHAIANTTKKLSTTLLIVYVHANQQNRLRVVRTDETSSDKEPQEQIEGTSRKGSEPEAALRTTSGSRNGAGGYLQVVCQGPCSLSETRPCCQAQLGARVGNSISVGIVHTLPPEKADTGGGHFRKVRSVGAEATRSKLSGNSHLQLSLSVDKGRTDGRERMLKRDSIWTQYNPRWESGQSQGTSGTSRKVPVDSVPWTVRSIRACKQAPFRRHLPHTSL
jgi:hypothetical protein